MTRLIDADELIDRIESDKKQDNISPGNFFLFKAYIMNAPTIESDGDTISRRAAIELIKNSYYNLAENMDDVWAMVHDVESLPSAEQVTGKLNNPDDSLLTADSEACKEQKSKLDLISREEVLRMIIVAGECEPDLGYTHLHTVIESLPSAEPKTGEWIPVSEIRKLEAVVYMHIDSLEGTRNIVEAGMLSAWKEVAEYVDGMLGEDGEA